MSIYSVFTPYTYFIMWRGTNTKYYGCQYGKKANPENILTGRYTTSSVSVNEHWQKYGPPDIVVIHRTFTTAAECRLYEHTYIKRVKAVYKEDWLNKSDSKAILTDNYSDSSWKNSHKSRRRHMEEDPEFRKFMVDRFVNLMQSDAANLKRKETFVRTKHSQGENNPRFGAILTPEILTKISEARKKQYSLNKSLANKLNQKNRSCEYCGKSGLNAGNYKRWHGNKCKIAGNK